MLSGVIPHLSAQATAETVTVTEPGTLSTLIDQLPSTRIQSLTVKGALNAADIACLRKGAGKLVKTESLDISEITLVPSEESYGSLVVEVLHVGGALHTQYYYISDEYKVDRELIPTGLGGMSIDEYVYCNDLSGAFAECKNYKTVKLPVTMSRVGDYMFMNNEIIESAELPTDISYLGYKSFFGSSSLKNISLPDGVTKIFDHTFADSGLESVTFSEKLDTIGEAAFQNCHLTSIDLEHVKYIGAEAFFENSIQGELNLSRLDTIHASSFSGNFGTECLDIKFSERLKIIEDGAFGWCNVKGISLPEGLERIGNSSFQNCHNLESVTIPESLFFIGEDAFRDTPWATNLQSENGVTYIGKVAYKYDAASDPGLSTFSFRDGTVSIGCGFFPSHKQEQTKRITKIELPSSIEYIGESAFWSMTNINEINFPEGLKEIGGGAFAYCDNLWISKFPDSLERIGDGAFGYCHSIPDVTLPENLELIGASAFQGCEGISKVTLKSHNLKVATTGSYRAFANCPNLQKLVVGSNVKYLPRLGFEVLGSVEFEDIENSKLQIIDDNCFGDCTSLLEIKELPKSIRRIGHQAFRGSIMCDFDCPNIESIGAYAFAYCTGMKKVILPEKDLTFYNEFNCGGAFFGCPDISEVIVNSTNISEEGEGGNYNIGIFGKCPGLKKVTIGKNSRTIPAFMFYECENLSDITFEERPMESPQPLSIGSYSFSGCDLSGEISFPEGLEIIGECAFGDNHISTVTLPSTCRELMLNAFYYNDLTSVKLNEGLVRLGEQALCGNRNLTTVDIPATCEEIGNYIFDNCSSLSTINMFPVTPPSFGESLGRISDDAVIYVPAESLKAYKAIPALSAYKVRPFTVKAESITLNNSELTLTVGETAQISATVLPEDTTDKTVAWTSSNSEVATVDADGIVTAISAGATTISATCGNLSATCAVTVTANSGISDINSSDISVTTTYGTITITGAASDDIIKIMRIDGTLVYHGTDKTVSSLSPGYYIVTVNSTTFKTAVR